MLLRTKNIALTLFRVGNFLASPPSENPPYTKEQGAPQETAPKPEPGKTEAPFATRHHSRDAWEALLTAVVILGDYLTIAAGFALAGVVCQSDFISSWMAGMRPSPLVQSYKLILPISAIVLWSMRGRQLYAYRNVLMPSKIWHTIVGALGVCISAFVVLSLVVKTEPPISWIYLVCSLLIICPGLFSWRLLVSRVIRLRVFASHLRRRLIVIGGGAQTLQILKTLGAHSDMEFVGWVQALKPNNVTELEEFRLGSLHELRNIFRSHAVNIAVLVESEILQREGVAAVTKACEMEHVQFAMVPHFFEIMVSAVRPGTIGEMQMLGVHCLPLHGLRNRVLKRTVDILGALVGLAISIPLMAIFGTLVFMESPGPVFYRQIRQGRNGRLFYIIKLRGMRLNAEADGKARWAQSDDNRRLQIGTFMRKWNIDEIPQFWNVLRGEMSLVGPRPERPELIARFESKIPHYQVRHMYQPGMTGWAQVNGWRGDTCLVERIRHDIWYLENWTFWLDFRVMLQTFFSRKNAY